MTNPTEQFREAIESALESVYYAHEDTEDRWARGITGASGTPAEALASIQASTLRFFTALVGEENITLDAEAGQAVSLDYAHGILEGENRVRQELRQKIDQLIKDLSK